MPAERSDADVAEVLSSHGRDIVERALVVGNDNKGYVVVLRSQEGDGVTALLIEDEALNQRVVNYLVRQGVEVLTELGPLGDAVPRPLRN